jgi:hypothetical protein
MISKETKRQMISKETKRQMISKETKRQMISKETKRQIKYIKLKTNKDFDFILKHNELWYINNQV